MAVLLCKCTKASQVAGGRPGCDATAVPSCGNAVGAAAKTVRPGGEAPAPEQVLLVELLRLMEPVGRGGEATEEPHDGNSVQVLPKDGVEAPSIVRSRSRLQERLVPVELERDARAAAAHVPFLHWSASALSPRCTGAGCESCRPRRRRWLAAQASLGKADLAERWPP